MDDLKTLVTRFENALVAEQQYDAYLERIEWGISNSQATKADMLRKAVNDARTNLLNYKEQN